MSILGTNNMTRVLICLGLCALTAPAATIYDLASDFSTTANPDGVWSYLQGSTALPLQSKPTDGNALNAAAANGYFGVASNFSTAPFIMKTSQDGASTSGYSDDDFLAGDIIAHSTSPGGGSPLFIDWTAPSDGTITYTGEVWYAHSPVTRSNDYSLTLDGGSDLASGTVTDGDGLNNPSTFDSSGTLTVDAGDVLQLELTPSAGQTLGSLAGVNETVDFTASSPEPGTILLLAGGLLGMAVAIKLRRAAIG
jgi:hypothetical protein